MNVIKGLQSFLLSFFAKSCPRNAKIITVITPSWLQPTTLVHVCARPQKKYSGVLGTEYIPSKYNGRYHTCQPRNVPDALTAGRSIRTVVLLVPRISYVRAGIF